MGEKSQKCIDPHRWKIPDENATDDQIVAYLDHLEKCSYHAALEESQMFPFTRAAGVVRSLSKKGKLELSEEEEAAFQENLDLFLTHRDDGQLINAISIRINGEDRLPLKRSRYTKFRVKNCRAIEFWRPSDVASPDIMLGTFLLPNVSRKPHTASTSLWDGQTLRVEALPSRLGRIRVKVFWGDTEPSAAWSLGRLWPKDNRSLQIAALAVCCVTLLVAFILYLTLGHKTTSPVPDHASKDANIAPAPRPSTVTAENPDKVKPDESANQTSTAQRQKATSNSSQQIAATRPQSDRDTGQLRSGATASGVRTLSALSTLSIDQQQSEFDHLLRGALRQSIPEVVGITIEDGGEKAQARMRLIERSEAIYIFKIISGGNTLFETTEEISGKTPGAAIEAAKRVAVKMKETIKKERKKADGNHQ